MLKRKMVMYKGQYFWLYTKGKKPVMLTADMDILEEALGVSVHEVRPNVMILAFWEPGHFTRHVAVGIANKRRTDAMLEFLWWQLQR